ncbi:hypothetical protein ABZV52_30120 [Streptomyces sp. NPDC004735]|uniref:hypothetical protein n=1 Tax=Streptomyces sp. NPDC004735 TaxID=3156654 RepID=UPI0033AF0ECF
MDSNTNIARPTPYQAKLLLAALADNEHRIPSDANGRTLDLFLGRRWVEEYTADGRLAAGVRDYSGFTHFRLSRSGVNTAKRAQAHHDFRGPKKARTVNGWTCVEPGRRWAREVKGVKFELERRTRNLDDECPDTGWYLYGGTYFGEYTAVHFAEASSAAEALIFPEESDSQPAATPAVDAPTDGKSARQTVVYGALAESLTVPQVDAAIRVLMLGRQPLAAFHGSRCVSDGAYLDPRRDAGQVVLGYLRKDIPVAVERPADLRAQTERILGSWADLFQSEGWRVDRYRETDPHDTYRLVRCVLTPPAEVVPVRVLTPLEHHAAWHAIEGAAGEEGADPGTVLNAVLRVLRIAAPPGE